MTNTSTARRDSQNMRAVLADTGAWDALEDRNDSLSRWDSFACLLTICNCAISISLCRESTNVPLVGMLSEVLLNALNTLRQFFQRCGVG